VKNDMSADDTANETSAVRIAIATRGLRSIAGAAYRAVAGRRRVPKPRSMSAIQSNQGASCTRKKKVVSQTKLGRPALGKRIVLELKALATPAAIANAPMIEASRKSRGTLYLSRPNRDCAGVNMSCIRQLLYDCQCAVHLLDRCRLDLS